MQKEKTSNPLRIRGLKWWRLPELNWGHADFQSAALPTELSRRKKQDREVYANTPFSQSVFLMKPKEWPTWLKDHPYLDRKEKMAEREGFEPSVHG